MKNAIIHVGAFLEAFRDAGYRGLAGALSELIDNALQASAKRIEVNIKTIGNVVQQVSILDDGVGMAPSIIVTALQFGGSTRFDSRLGTGRYGLGLPGSSISRARRVDVYSWTRKGMIWRSHLAIDEVRSGALQCVPQPVRGMPEEEVPEWARAHGTLVVWSECDRIPALTAAETRRLRHRLGRTFRRAIWSGRTLMLGNEPVEAIDPLFLRHETEEGIATPYGPPLHFDFDLVGFGKRSCAPIEVRLSQLPIEKWYSLPNATKRELGITNNPGVSILRAGREIDVGWFFMGSKRKESYDDWWRCEVSFEPQLDEFFGVTHTKQGIRPSAALEAILAPHLERAAHDLNRSVRLHFQKLRATRGNQQSEQVASRRDHILEPPRMSPATRRRAKSRGLHYELTRKPIDSPEFFTSRRRGPQINVTLNTRHPFTGVLDQQQRTRVDVFAVELVVLAAARADLRLRSRADQRVLSRYREHWSNALAAFFS